jgi:EpsI family protein
MLNQTFSLSFLKSRPAAIVSALLILEAVVFYAAPTAEHIPHPPLLTSFTRDFGDWKMVRETEIDADTQSLLRADDTVSRTYMSSGGPLSLFVAFFKSQRGGVTPHSPKICLPGNGWTPEGSRIIAVDVPGESSPLPVNRYLVRHDDDRVVVLYWYTTRHYAIANEYLAKVYLMREGLLHRRSDEAVYRVIVPIGADGENAAEQRGIQFIQSVFPPLKRQMWSD